MLNKKKLKIVAAIDTSPLSVAVLDEAATCAKLFEGELHVILVEDINMVNVTKSPLVRSVNLFSSSTETITSNEIEDIFALQRKTANKTVKYAEDMHNIKISLEIKRGKVIEEIMNFAEGSDALMIGLAGWKFAKYYYSTHMIEKQSRFKFPAEGSISVGSTAKKLLKDYKGTILALRSSIVKKAKVLIYYDGSKLTHSALENTLEHLSHIKRRTSISLAILLSDKNLRNEAFLMVSEKNKDITPTFHTLKSGTAKENMDYIIKLIDNTKSNILTLPDTCKLIKEDEFYENLGSLGITLVIMR